ncbi:MAG: hypothetical protein ABI668_13050 [Sphingorhabdus sp.]
MSWRNYEPSQTGKTCIIDGDSAHDVQFEMGTICTGRQRVFHRYYVKVYLSDGSTVIGENPYNLRAAVLDLDGELKRRDAMLLAAGTDSDWLESGLSQNSGWGYFSNATEASHMMSLPPLRHRDSENDEFVDRIIREAVDGMFSQK